MRTISGSVVQGRLSEHYSTPKIIACNILDSKYLPFAVYRTITIQNQGHRQDFTFGSANLFAGICYGCSSLGVQWHAPPGNLEIL